MMPLHAADHAYLSFEKAALPVAAERGLGVQAITAGQMEDNIRTVQDLTKMSAEEMEDVRKRALVGAGVQTGPGLEYWKKKA